MSLNKLALSVWERLGFKDIDASVISRFISGERLPTFGQQKVISEVLQLSSNSQDRLSEALLVDYHTRIGLEDNFLKSRGEVVWELVGQNLEKLRQIKLSNVDFTESWLENMSEKVDSEFLVSINENVKKRLLQLKGEILKEQILCFSVTQTKKISSGRLFNLANDLKKIGFELKDDDLVAVGDYEMGNNNYVKSHYDVALNIMRKKVKTDYDSLDSGITAALRVSLLCQAYTRKLVDFDLTKKMLLKKMPVLPIDLQQAVLGALSRGSAILGKMDDSDKFMQMAKQRLKEMDREKNDRAGMRRVQTILTEMESEKYMNGTYKKSYLNKIGMEAVNISRDHGFKRLEENARDLLVGVCINGGW